MSQKRVTKTGKTRWVARYRNNAGKEHSKSFETRREAKAYEEEQERALRRREWIDPGDGTTLYDLAVDWIAEATRPNTIANCKVLQKNLGDLASLPVRLINAGDIAQWHSQLLNGRPWAGGKALAPSTTAVMTGQLTGLLKRAVDDGLLAKVPRISARKASPRAAISRQDLLTPEEIWKIISTAEEGTRGRKGPGMPPKPWLASKIWVSIGTGLRLSEVCALHPEDIDEVHRELMVERQTIPGGKRLARSRCPSRAESHSLQMHYVS